MPLRIAFLSLSLTLAAARAETPVTIELDAPSPAYSLSIESVHRADGEIWVLARAHRVDRIAPHVITKISATFTMDAPKAKTRFFIHGDVWKWIDKDRFTIVKDVAAFRKKIADTTRIEFTPTPE